MAGGMASGGNRRDVAASGGRRPVPGAQRRPRIAMIETDGWDTHSAQAPRLANQLKGWTPWWPVCGRLGATWAQTVVLVATEFAARWPPTAPAAQTTAPARWPCCRGGAVQGGRVVADWRAGPREPAGRPRSQADAGAGTRWSQRFVLKASVSTWRGLRPVLFPLRCPGQAVGLAAARLVRQQHAQHFGPVSVQLLGPDPAHAPASPPASAAPARRWPPAWRRGRSHTRAGSARHFGAPGFQRGKAALAVVREGCGSRRCLGAALSRRTRPAGWVTDSRSSTARSPLSTARGAFGQLQCVEGLRPPTAGAPVAISCRSTPRSAPAR